MKKLFALEENTESNNDLLIDKVLKKAQIDKKSPMSLTADLLKERQSLKQEITKRLEKEPNTEESADKPADEETPSEDTEQPTDKDQETKSSEDENSDKESDSKEDSPEPKEANTSEDDEPEDKEGLAALVGSDLNKDTKDSKPSKEDKEAPKDKKDKPATESFKFRATTNNIFNCLSEYYSDYKVSLEAYNLATEAVKVTEQPIAYVKDSVIKSLNNLIDVAQSYIKNNNTFTEQLGQSVKVLNEKITVFKSFVENSKYHFTNTLVSDKDLLSMVCAPNKSDPLETVRILLKYLDSSNAATSLMVSNSFDTVTDSYKNKDFTEEGQELSYKDILPGFDLVKISVPNYQNYLKTKIQEFQYYKLKVLKTEDLFNLDAIGITEDKELLFLTEALDKLLVSVSTGVDNLNGITTHFASFIDEIKVIIYDIEQGKHKNLASIDIDSKVKDFIKFKLAIEAYYININTTTDYMTSMMSVLNQVVELKH